jgi:HEAT repeat protein
MARMAEESLDLNFRDVFLCCLSDERPKVRVAAISGLCDDEGHAVLEGLLQLATEDPSDAVRREAVLALERFAYLIETTDRFDAFRGRLLRLMLGILGDPTASLDMRRGALIAASFFGGIAEVEESIAQAYRAPESEMRVIAVRAMGHHLADRWRPLIEGELTSSDGEMRREAARACGEIGDPELVAHLAPLLGDEERTVVVAAIWALGEIGGERARRLLERCLKRDETDVREAAEQALHTIRFFDDPMGWLS